MKLIKIRHWHFCLNVTYQKTKRFILTLKFSICVHLEYPVKQMHRSIKSGSKKDVLRGIRLVMVGVWWPLHEPIRDLAYRGHPKFRSFPCWVGNCGGVERGKGGLYFLEAFGPYKKPLEPCNTSLFDYRVGFRWTRSWWEDLSKALGRFKAFLHKNNIFTTSVLVSITHLKHSSFPVFLTRKHFLLTQCICHGCN